MPPRTPGAPLDAVRAVASASPEAERAFLFGDHEVFRVRKKVYVWLGALERGGTYVSATLKDTRGAALLLPFVTPAAYGMATWGRVDQNKESSPGQSERSRGPQRNRS